MDSDYYYYYFNDCNLINYTNYLGGNRNGKEIIWYFKRKRLC